MFFRQIAALTIAMIVAQPVLADEEKDAMFGLRWGMTPAAVKTMGVSISKEKGDKNLETYAATSLPKHLSDIEKYLLIFSDGKLVKLVAIGKDITGDPTGRDGKERFEILKKSLEDKYGSSSNNYQSVGNKLFKEYDEFYQCLAYSGCGMWVAIFKTTTKVILLELNGLRRGSGYMKLAAEAVPEWNEALEKLKSFKNKTDSDAL